MFNSSCANACLIHNQDVLQDQPRFPTQNKICPVFKNKDCGDYRDTKNMKTKTRIYFYCCNIFLIFDYCQWFPAMIALSLFIKMAQFYRSHSDVFITFSLRFSSSAVGKNPIIFHVHWCKTCRKHSENRYLQIFIICFCKDSQSTMIKTCCYLIFCRRTDRFPFTGLWGVKIRLLGYNWHLSCRISTITLTGHLWTTYGRFYGLFCHCYGQWCSGNLWQNLHFSHCELTL